MLILATSPQGGRCPTVILGQNPGVQSFANSTYILCQAYFLDMFLIYKDSKSAEKSFEFFSLNFEGFTELA